MPIFVLMAMRNPRNEELITAFGQNVRKFRLEKGLTMNELALECDVEYGAISTIERGKVNCSISTAFAIAKALNTPIEKLLTIETDQ